MTCDVTAVTDAWVNQLEKRLAWVISTIGNSGNTILLTGTANYAKGTRP